jgi:hypothetical protein
MAERVMMVFGGTKTLDEKMKDVLGYDLNAKVLVKEKNRKVLSPLGAMAVSGAA